MPNHGLESQSNKEITSNKTKKEGSKWDLQKIVKDLYKSAMDQFSASKQEIVDSASNSSYSPETPQMSSKPIPIDTQGRPQYRELLIRTLSDISEATILVEEENDQSTLSSPRTSKASYELPRKSTYPPPASPRLWREQLSPRSADSRKSAYSVSPLQTRFETIWGNLQEDEKKSESAHKDVTKICTENAPHIVENAKGYSTTKKELAEKEVELKVGKRVGLTRNPGIRDTKLQNLLSEEKETLRKYSDSLKMLHDKQQELADLNDETISKTDEHNKAMEKCNNNFLTLEAETKNLKAEVDKIMNRVNKQIDKEINDNLEIKGLREQLKTLLQDMTVQAQDMKTSIGLAGDFAFKQRNEVYFEKRQKLIDLALSGEKLSTKQKTFTTLDTRARPLETRIEAAKGTPEWVEHRIMEHIAFTLALSKLKSEEGANTSIEDPKSKEKRLNFEGRLLNEITRNAEILEDALKPATAQS